VLDDRGSHSEDAAVRNAAVERNVLQAKQQRLAERQVQALAAIDGSQALALGDGVRHSAWLEQERHGGEQRDRQRQNLLPPGRSP
jgi:hypothetical protein